MEAEHILHNELVSSEDPASMEAILPGKPFWK
jgi:hypothetical protein